MLEKCTNYMSDQRCLLRQLAEGSKNDDTIKCAQCEVTVSELELAPQIIEEVATALSKSKPSQTGLTRIRNLAQGAWPSNASSLQAGGLSGGLCVRCPICASHIDCPDDSSLDNLSCSSCGEPFRFVDDSATDQPRTIGHFELKEQVGAGSFGIVWRAQDTQLDRTVAIKIPRRGDLSARESEEFVREAQASAQLNHPNIVSVHEIGRAEDTVFIVSDFIEGMTLEESMHHNVFSSKESAQLCATIADGLQHAHEQGVIHRDLKPANIAIDTRLKPYIMDFGLARRPSTEVTMNADGKILGTPSYMSPEQARGESHSTDARSDIYSLGVVLFQLLTGERPFRGNLRMLLNQIMYDEPPNPQKLNGAVSSDLATISLKCLEKSPERRYQSAKELKDDLQRFLEGRPILARPTTSIERGWRWCQRNPLPATLTSLLFVSLAVGTTISTVNWKNASASANNALASATRSDNVLSVVTSAFESTDPELGSSADMTAKDILFRAEEVLEESELDDLGRARVLASLSKCFVGVGEYDSALATAEAELAIQQAKTPVDNVALIAAMNRTAIAYRLAGKLDEGFSMCEEALKLATDSLPAEHSELLNAKQNIASIYESKDLIEKAIEYSKQVYDTCQRLDPDNRDAIWSANSLATKYRNAERFDDAIQLLQTAFDKSKKRLGEDHPFTLMVQNNLVDTSEAMGNIKVAVSLGEDLVTRRIEKLGPDHPDTISSMNNLAFAFQSDGQIDKALELFEKTLASSQKKLGEDHPSTMTLVNNLAMTYWRAKQLDKSIPLFESVIEHLEKQMGRDHIYTQTTIANLGVNYRDDKQYDLAAVYLEEAYNASKSDPRLEWVSESLRGLYVKDERDEDFLKLVDDELETARKRYKTSELGLLDIMASIGRDLVSSKHYQQAEKLLQQTLKDSEALGADHWRNCHVNSLLGAIRLRTERIDEAAPMLESGYLGMKAQADDIPGYNRTTFLKGAAQTLVEYAELIEDADALAKWQAEFDSYSPTN